MYWQIGLEQPSSLSLNTTKTHDILFSLHNKMVDTGITSMGISIIYTADQKIIENKNID
jgi:hypothetical protein